MAEMKSEYDLFFGKSHDIMVFGSVGIQVFDFSTAIISAVCGININDSTNQLQSIRTIIYDHRNIVVNCEAIKYYPVLKSNRYESLDALYRSLLSDFSPETLLKASCSHYEGFDVFLYSAFIRDIQHNVLSNMVIP